MSNVADNTHSAASVPRHSATILLLREAQGQIEVLMVRRHANLVFMGGLWVFPGGALNPADSAADALALIADPGDFSCHRMRTLQGEPLSAPECLGLAIAACRETFEEAGVLLARHEDGRPCDAEVVARLHKQRALVIEQPAMFISLLAREGLHPDVGNLVYWAHWITPSSSPRRFDTRFFIVASPPSQSVAADCAETAGTGETVESAWMSPASAIEAAQRGEMPISNPTLCNLHELQAAIICHGTLDELLKQETSRTVVPVLPKMVRENGISTIVLPWDASYASSPGEGVPAGLEYPRALLELPSRVVDVKRSDFTRRPLGTQK